MKAVLSHLIDDFHERRLPDSVPRTARLAGLPGKVDVVIGMRRSGKTFFCFQVIGGLVQGGVDRERILYINFEDDRLAGFSLADFQGLVDVYFGKYPALRDTTCYFFFDEIQRIAGWELFIRRLLDTEDVQICLTGSSARLLGIEIATSLRGRALTTEIFPFSFAEFLTAQGVFAKPPERFGARTAAALRNAVARYLDTGGFPEVQSVEAHVRVEILQGYVDSVILRDVIERYGVRNVTALQHMVRTLMHAPGCRFSVNKFYNTLRSMSVRCTKNSLYDYLDHLVDAYLVYKTPVHTRSAKARMLHPPKIYAVDTGLLKAMSFRNADNHGALLENLVFLHLRRAGYDIEYVRTGEGYEVDFFCRDRRSGHGQLIQVCWELDDPGTLEREARALRSAMDQYGLSQGTIVTWDDSRELEGNIAVVPVWRWLLSPNM